MVPGAVAGAIRSGASVQYWRTQGSRPRVHLGILAPFHKPEAGHLLPPEVSRLLAASDPAAREVAWKTFLEAHSRLLLHAARGLGRDYDAAMDAYAYLVEQLQADDFRRLRAYVSEPGSKFTTWLVVVARRLCLDRLRERYGRAADAGGRGHAARLVRRRLIDLLAEELDSDAASAHAAPDSTEMQLRTEELNRALTDALDHLAPADRLLLKLRFDDGLSGREIGHIMGFGTPLQVYRRVNALLAQLRKSLQQRGFEGPEP